MNRFLVTVVFITGLSFSASVVNSQEHQGCFMFDNDGELIDLSKLCSGSNQTVKLNSGLSQIPIKRRYSGIPVIDVTFNDGNTFEMLFDTGASGISITPEMAQSLGVEAQGVANSSTAGGVVEVDLGKVDSITLGGIEVQDLEVSINENLEIGLLGQSFYGGYDVTIKETMIELRPR